MNNLEKLIINKGLNKVQFGSKVWEHMPVDTENGARIISQKVIRYCKMKSLKPCKYDLLNKFCQVLECKIGDLWE